MIKPKTYIDSGYDITVLRQHTKKPKLNDWVNITLTADDFDSYGSFPEHYNIGIKLGEKSNGIVDVDLDCAASVLLGISLLNTDTQVFGRADNPGGHYFYRVPDPRNTMRFKHPITGKVLVELRGNGGQTVLPGSIYEDGSKIRFEDYSLPEPLLTDWDTLERQCRFIAAGCVLSELWTEGSRHLLAVRIRDQAAIAAQPANKLLTAYRLYIDVKLCFESRKGYEVVYLNEEQLSDAKTRVVAIEHGVRENDPTIDTDAIWRQANDADMTTPTNGLSAIIQFADIMGRKWVSYPDWIEESDEFCKRAYSSLSAHYSSIVPDSSIVKKDF